MSKKIKERAKEFYRLFNKVFVSVSLLTLWGIIGLTNDIYTGIFLVGLSLMITIFVVLSTRIDNYVSNRKYNRDNK